MEFRLALAQTIHPEDDDVVALVERMAAAAGAAGADILAFPECLMSRYDQDRASFAAQSQDVGGPFCRAVEQIAAQHGLWMVYTLNERNDSSPAAKPYNTAVVVDSKGQRHGVYRKVHLFDSDYTTESDRMSAGDALFDPIDTPFGKLGVAICYDLRFPEVARHAALRGCGLLIYTAAWVDGEHKVQQWKTLLAARAIENQIFVAGLSRADKERIGRSCVFAPNGEELAQAGSGEELLLCDLDTAVLEKAKRKMPVLQHRRPELYD